MSNHTQCSRRALLSRIAAGLAIGPRAFAAEAPWLSEQDPKAKAVRYVEDAARAKEAQSGANCSNCSIFTAGAGADATSGSCTLFPGTRVKSAGWCSSWSGL